MLLSAVTLELVVVLFVLSVSEVCKFCAVVVEEVVTLGAPTCTLSSLLGISFNPPEGIVFALAGAIVQVLFIINFIYSIFYGPKSSKNPWGSNTLEWTTPIERIHGNWPGELPVVHRWAYDYSKPGAKEDFIPQTVPLEEGEEDH